MCPQRARAFFSLRGRARTMRRYCGADAGGEVDPIPGDGGVSPSEGECLFGRLRRRGFRTLRRAGTRPSRGEGQKGIGHQGFLSPLATPQLSFAPLSVASQRSGGREGYGTPQTVRRWLASLCSTGCFCRFAAHDSARPDGAEESDFIRETFLRIDGAEELDFPLYTKRVQMVLFIYTLFFTYPSKRP